MNANKPSNRSAEPATAQAFAKLLEERDQPAREQAQREEEARQKWWQDLAVRNAMRGGTPAPQISEPTPAAAANKGSFVEANRKAREARLALSSQGMSRASMNIAAGLKLSTPSRGPTKPAA